MNKPNNNRADRGKNRKSGNVKLTPEEEKYRLAKELRIDDRTKDFYDELINNPKTTKRDAYIKTRGESTSLQQASVNASRLINSDKYRIYKQSVVGKAKKRIASLVDSNNESIALKASTDILDRTEGKAIQRNITQQNTVEVKLDLSGVRLGAHFVPPAVNVPIEQE